MWAKGMVGGGAGGGVVGGAGGAVGYVNPLLQNVTMTTTTGANYMAASSVSP